MEKLKVKANSEAESKEVQRLFFELGYEMGACSIGFYPVVIITTKSWGAENWCSTRAIGLNHPAHENHKEITLQELRDMVKPKMKEYLFKYNDQYTLVELSKEDAESNPEQYIKIPEKYDAFIELNSGEKVFYKWHTNGHCLVDGSRLNLLEDFVPKVKHVLWKRNNNITGISDMSVQESLNDKIATAEVARQQSKSIDTTLAERQSQYGCFEDVAFVTENIMATLAKVRSNGLHDLPHTHRMALYMIASKMARIVNGDFNHLDSWHDIGGYSKLIEDLIAVDQ